MVQKPIQFPFRKVAFKWFYTPLKPSFINIHKTVRIKQSCIFVKLIFAANAVAVGPDSCMV